MNKKYAAIGIDFADSNYKSLHMENSNLTVHLDAWDGKIIKILFINTIQFMYKLESTPKKLYEVLDSNNFLNEALLQEYGYIPTAYTFKLFQLEDIDNFPFLQVVAEDVKVTKE